MNVLENICGMECQTPLVLYSIQCKNASHTNQYSSVVMHLAHTDARQPTKIKTAPFQPSPYWTVPVVNLKFEPDRYSASPGTARSFVGYSI